MSNVSQTSEQIKKKMKFDDYTVSPQQPAATSTSSHVNEPTSHTSDKETYQHVDKSISGHSSLSISRSEDMSTSHADNEVTKSTMPHSAQSTSQRIHKKTSELDPKRQRVTFYPTEESQRKLDELYVKGILEKNKVDKSALINEAIDLLYKKRMK